MEDSEDRQKGKSILLYDLALALGIKLQATKLCSKVTIDV